MSGSSALLVGVLLCLPAQTEEKPALMVLPKTPEQLAKQRVENLLREARTLYALGIRNTREDKLLQAIKLLETARKFDPDSAEIVRALYPLYEVLDRSEEALELAELVLDREPTDISTVLDHARMATRSEQHHRALHRLRRASEAKVLQEKPELAYKVLTQIAKIEQQQQLWRDLISTLQQITQLLAQSRKALLMADVVRVEDYEIVQGGYHEQIGATYLKLGNSLTALTEFKKANEFYAKIPDPKVRAQTGKIHWYMCEIYFERNDPKNALESLDWYLQQKPVELPPYERKIQLLKMLGRDREILPYLKKVSESFPERLPLRLLYAAQLSQSAPLRKEAEDFYLKLLEVHLKPEVYQGLFRLYQLDDRMTRIIDMVDDVEKALQEETLKPQNRDRLQLQQRAIRLALRNDKELVAALLPVCLQELNQKEKERKIHTWYFLAYLAQKTKQLDKAETLFRTCLREAPAHLEYQVYGGLLEVLWARRKPLEVEKVCRAALDGPRPARATFPGLFHRNIARVLAERGDLEGAIKEITKAIDISAEDTKVNALTIRAQYYAQLGKREKAVSECEAILKEFKDPKHQRAARLTLANVYSQIGQPDQAEAQLRFLLEINPDDSLALNNLGYQLADSGKRLEEAERLLRRAIAIERAALKDIEEDDVSASTLDSLGWVLFRRGKYEEAREYIEKAVLISDGQDDAILLDHLGDVYVKLGLIEKALNTWQKALRQIEFDPRPKKEERKTQLEKKIRALSR
ncbi:MAG: tetratricopeptide repeat protein [Gemmataceae bacterium]|nr:tetratricopeptide repeat protein [Gemmataceae bacterium]